MIPAHQMARIMKKMSPEERQFLKLVFEVWQGDDRTRLYLQVISHCERREDILRYLLRERLCGERLIEYAQNVCDGSPMKLAVTIIMKLNLDRAPKALIFGKDFR